MYIYIYIYIYMYIYIHTYIYIYIYYTDMSINIYFHDIIKSNIVTAVLFKNKQL